MRFRFIETGFDRFVLIFYIPLLTIGQTLAEGKLKTFFKELKEQDKDEIKVKKIKAEGQDKGTKASEVRRRFALLLSRYNLQNVFTSQDDDEDSGKDNQVVGGLKDAGVWDKQIFKDKKLDRLWQKAQQQYFDDDEMTLLKEEFRKYESRLSDYDSQVERVALEEQKIRDKLEKRRNSIDSISEDYPTEHLRHLKEKHRDLKRHLNALEDQVLRRQPAHEREAHFDEPRVAKLWKLATKVGFDGEELGELREELQHFESRLKKVAYLHEHYSIDGDNVKRSMDDKHVDTDGSKHIRSRLEDLTKHADKLERDLEVKIMSRHVEL